MRPKRFESLDERPANRETFVEPWADAGLTVTGSPHDPSPGLTIEEGLVTEVDGLPLEQFDLIDHFIARDAVG